MKSFILIPSIDLLLCFFLGTKARWFQLHCVVNGIIVYYIKDDVYNLLLYPDKIVTLDNPENYIIYVFYICIIFCFLKIQRWIIFIILFLFYVEHYQYIIFIIKI